MASTQASRPAAAWLLGMAMAIGLGAAAAAPPSSRALAMQRYEPDCARDEACEVWRQFRRNHPFPVQTFAGQRVGQRAVLIFSEPSLPEASLRDLVKRLFAADHPQVQTRRWMIGQDGWLEDLVVSIDWRPGNAKATDLLADPLLRDRLALIAERQWGTAFGLQLEPATADYAARARARTPDLDPNPAEVRDWLRDAQLRWHGIAGDGAPRGFDELAKSGAGGAYASGDGQLTLLILGRSDIELAQKTPLAFQNRWRAAFRTFAVATDSVLGAAWTDNGSLAFLGRLRRVPADVVAPLRFETFALLARTGTRELAQSYERTTPLAGKMLGGRYGGSDWAPIYLSRSLIDTEFGALLNITDQMLKSWSMAGQIDYLYFDYPLRPAASRFAFGAKPLSELVLRETGSTQVLFNWNTSGGAAVVSGTGLNVITPTRTGALPITYGAELSPGGGMKYGGQVASLQRHERNAYAFFAGLRDPNLARVVSYTVMYQAFQAYMNRDDGPAAPGDESIAERQAAMKTLADELARILRALDKPETPEQMAELRRRIAEQMLGRKIVASADMRLRTAEEARRQIQEIQSGVRQLRAIDPRYADPQAVAALLVNYRGELRTAQQAYVMRAQAFDRDVRDYNAKRGSFSRSDLEARRTQLDREDRRLTQLSQQVTRLHGVLFQTLDQLSDLDHVRERFVAANATPPAGWIKTPSVVISRNVRDIGSIGGHNLDARALKILVDPATTEATIVEQNGNRILRVPPAQAEGASARANEIARQVEHGKAGIASVRETLAQPRIVRTRADALQAGTPGDLAAIAGRGGRESIADARLRAELGALYDSLGERFAGLARREANGDYLLYTRLKGEADCCARARDMMTLRQELQRWKGKGDIALVDVDSPQTHALAMNLRGHDDAVMIEALGGGRGGEPPNGTITFIRGNGAEPPGGGTGGKPPGGMPPGGTPPGGTPPGGTPPSGKPPGGSGRLDPMLLALRVERGTASEAQAALSAPRRFGRTDAPLFGRDADAELLALQKSLHGAERWDTARDGQPAVFRLRFVDVDPAVPALEAKIFAGVDPQGAQGGIKVVRDAIDTAQQERPSQSLFDLQTRVKALVERHADGGFVKRLLTRISESRLGLLMSRAPSDATETPAS